MSVFSGTFAPTADQAFFTLGDPIVEAREKLRQAARIPFAAARPAVWQARFQAHAASARQAVRDHIRLAALPDSPITRIEQQAPRLIGMVQRQRDEHEAVSRQADELVELAGDHGKIDIWQMIDLDEKAILLEMALARHHNRLMQLACELETRPDQLA